MSPQIRARHATSEDAAATTHIHDLGNAMRVAVETASRGWRRAIRGSRDAAVCPAFPLPDDAGWRGAAGHLRPENRTG